MRTIQSNPGSFNHWDTSNQLAENTERRRVAALLVFAPCGVRYRYEVECRSGNCLAFDGGGPGARISPVVPNTCVAWGYGTRWRGLDRCASRFIDL